MKYETQVWPSNMVEVDQWVTWRYIDGRKQPHSVFSDAKNKMRWSLPENWGDFSTALDAYNSVPFLEGPGFALQKENDPYHAPADPFVLVDFDDVRDPETGVTHNRARHLIESADTYADISTSDTGAHLIGRGTLPDGVKTIQDDFPGDDRFPDAEIEVYDGKRFVAMTGKHVVGTPETANDITDILGGMADTFNTSKESSGDFDPSDLPDNKEYADVELTDDFDDVVEAIKSVGPRDISVRSAVTNQRADGSLDLNPTWAKSKSGTRLAAFPDRGMWVYRDGMKGLDALQVVALEEHIVSSVDKYPDGEDFWRAVERLRERGANIPRYSGSDLDRLAAFKSDKSVGEWFSAASELSG